MMGSLLKLNNDHRIGLVCDVGLKVQLIDVRRRYPGGRLNKKDGLTRYGNSHVKDKTS